MNAATDTPATPCLQDPLSVPDALLIAKAKFPLLCSDGIRPLQTTLDARPVSLRQAAAALSFLFEYGRVSDVPLLSRDLRRAAGHWASMFISNGSVIVASVAAGLDVRAADRRHWPDALIGVAFPDVTKRRARR